MTTTKPSKLTESRTTPTYECRRVTESPTPDARLDQAPWRDAEWIDQFQLIDVAEYLPEERYLQAALLWDDVGLYVGYRSAPSLVPVTKTQRDGDLWTESAVELFLAAGAGYYEFQINPLGAVLDLHFPDEDADDWERYRAWDAGGMTWAVRSTGRPGKGVAGWEAELSLPWSAIPQITHETTDAGNVIWAQLSRSSRRPDGTYELPAWGPANKRFCDHAGMGRLLLAQ